MNQKSFTNIIWVIGIVVLAGAVGYLTLVRKPTPSTPSPTTTQVHETQPPSTPSSTSIQKSIPTPTPIPTTIQILETQQPTSTTSTPSSEIMNWKTYRNEENGFEVTYSSEYQIRGAVWGSEFIVGADCKSVEIIDFPTPGVDGGVALNLHSFVQICSKPPTDGLTLDDFMRQTYKDKLTALFQLTMMNGIPVYRATKGSPTIIFLQTNNYRFQIASAVVATPETQPERTFQIQNILSTLKFTR